jgi:serine/threonine protein kinase
MPQILDGKYTLGKSLGEGGFCRVHEATDSSGNKYAVKTWIEFQQKMFEDETRATSISEHPHLVNYISASPKGTLENTNSGETSEVAYILMEHVGGGELLESLMDHGGFSEEISRYFFKQLLMGLSKMHLEGLCHRDLKPENILFTADDYDIKITDFGFLLPVEGRDRTAWLKSRVGTLTYMAPEVFNR